MSRAVQRWILFCLALLLTAGATYFEYQALGAALTSGDIVEHPGYSKQQLQQDIRELEHKANIYIAEAAACLIFASLCLGTALRRGYSKYSVAVYIGSFVVCPLISFLPIYILMRLYWS